MWTSQRRRTNRGALIVPAMAVAFLTYFGFHAWNGEYGIYNKYRLEDQITALNSELEGLVSTRTALERRVQLLHDGTLEKDILDEQARKLLNLANGDEVIIMLDTEKTD